MCNKLNTDVPKYVKQMKMKIKKILKLLKVWKKQEFKENVFWDIRYHINKMSMLYHKYNEDKKVKVLFKICDIVIRNFAIDNTIWGYLTIDRP